jgi:two-component system, NtrC family, sensor histidine kinase HydH
MNAYFENIKSYVGFTDADTQVLRELAGPGEAYFWGFSEHFYDCITRHPDAHRVLEGPEQIERLKRTLIEWMRSGLIGPHDETFYERRARIGRVHVRIALPQQYMFTAVNVMRLDFRRMVEQVYESDRQRERQASDAVDKLFDLELAIMLQTYREDSEERLRRSERLATIGQIAASIGHDLRNPLSVIQSSLYILQKRMASDPRSSRHLSRINTQVELCDNIINNLLPLARNQPPRRLRVDFEELFGDVVSGLSQPPHVKVEISIEPELELYGDTGLLRQAIANMLSNAVQAHDDKPGTVYISARSEDDHAIIEVADEGPGFDPETLARAFEPLVTTRITGTGLGLALVKGVTERHGGTVSASNRPTGGAAVRMRLPKSIEHK